MHDEDNPIAISVRCRVTGWRDQKSCLPTNLSGLLPVLEREGWRFAKRGDKSLPVCPKHYPRYTT